MDKYKEITDENLAKMAQEGDVSGEEYLIRRYKGVIRNKAKAYFIIGADSEDVVQEGMIGLFKAIKTYDVENETTFKTYAHLCINRQLISAIKAANRNKHVPLNTSVSLSKLVERYGDFKERTLEETLKSVKSSDFGNEVILDDVSKYVIEKQGQIFTNMEIEVWRRYISGESYKEIAENLQINIKAVYNAMERLKRKIRQHFES